MLQLFLRMCKNVLINIGLLAREAAYREPSGYLWAIAPAYYSPAGVLEVSTEHSAWHTSRTHLLHSYTLDIGPINHVTPQSSDYDRAQVFYWWNDNGTPRYFCVIRSNA